MRFGERRRVATAVVAAAAALLLPAAAAAQDAGPVTAGVTFFTGPNFTGSSKTLTLEPDQPYAAIPYVGNELNEKIASLRVDPQVGVILFQRPYFASRDDSCGPNIGTRSEEHTSELQSLMRISYAVFCLKKKKTSHPIETYI